MNATAYTPLESLLLFQSLAAFGTEPNVFAQISNILKNNVLIRNSDKYDAARLSPDALRELYLQLLRDELKTEIEAGDASLSLKRKQPPILPTISEARNYNGKLPELVDRLYARYQEHMVRSIHEDDRKYEHLRRELKEIERGEWDERIRQEAARGKRTSSEDAFKRPSSIPRSSAQPERPVSRDADRAKVATPSPLPSPRTETRSEGLAISDVLNSTEPPAPTHAPAQAPEKDSVSRLKNGSHPMPPISHHRTSSNGNERPHGPSPLQPGGRLPPPGDWKWENYQGAPTQQPHQTQSQPPPPHGYQANYPPQAQQYSQYPPPPPRSSFSGALPPPHGQVPSSPHHNPIVLPPLNGGRGPGSPAGHLDQLADLAEQQQYRAPQSPMTTMPHESSVPPMLGHYTTSTQQNSQYMPPAGPPLSSYTNQYAHAPPPPFRSTPTHQSQSSAPPPPQPWNNQYQPQQQFPPPQPPSQNYFPAPTPPPPRQGSYSARPELPQINDRPQYNSPYNPSFRPPDIKSTPLSKPLGSLLKDVAPATPAAKPQALRTGKGTLWQITATPGTPAPPATQGKPASWPASPAYDPLSPVLQPVKPPTSAPRETAQAPPKTVEKEKRSRGRPDRPRASSTASTEPFPGISSRRETSRAATVKKEALAFQRLRDLAPEAPKSAAAPPMSGTATPLSEDDNATPELLPPLPHPSTSRKRKRSPEPAPAQPPTYVMWTRNFPRITAYALERIGAHRTASTFALPIKDKDAPGYHNAIKRPQDLTSIKNAIKAGNRAAQAALATMGNEVDKNAPTVMLPISSDLVPPKGIINNSQLEKELMLMFANAVMFNPDLERVFGRLSGEGRSRKDGAYTLDEDGVVKDARIMSGDVEEIVGELRSAEQRRSAEAEKARSVSVEGRESGSKSQEEAADETEKEGTAKKRKRN